MLPEVLLYFSDGREYGLMQNVFTFLLLIYLFFCVLVLQMDFFTGKSISTGETL